jgi:tetratricopeptide (TPR) repeat protein
VIQLSIISKTSFIKLLVLFSLIAVSKQSFAGDCGKKELSKFRVTWPTQSEEENFYNCFYDEGIYSISLPGFVKLALQAKKPSLQDKYVEKALFEVPRKYENFVYKKLSGKKLSLTPKVSSDLMYFFALRMFDQKNYKKSLMFLSKQIGVDFRRHGQSLFLKAVIMTKLNKLYDAEAIFSQLASGKFKTVDEETRLKIKSTSKLNLARIRIELEDYQNAVDNYRNVSFRDNMWFDGLVEMSWAMISRGDYEGAIGNAGFVEKSTSPFIYKPWLPVIESIGLLKICQYPNAKQTVERFNKSYKDSGEKTIAHIKKNGQKSWYQYASNILDTKISKSITKKIPPLLFYAARSNSVIGHQRTLNELFEEEEKLEKFYSKFKKDKHTYVYKLVSNRLGVVKKNINSSQKQMGQTFKDTVFSLLKEYSELQKIIDIVDFEIFSRSSDSITMRVAGEKFIDEIKKAGNKSASWNFNGEFWADEAGRFRSLLENKCPKNM